MFVNDHVCRMCVRSVLTQEYEDVLSRISPVVEQHKKSLVPGVPQLNMCDVAVMVRFTYYEYKVYL